MPPTKAVLDIILGTNGHGLAPWVGCERPSISVEWAVFVIFAAHVATRLALTPGKPIKATCVIMGNATHQSSAGHPSWYQWAWAGTLGWLHEALDQF